MKLCDFLSLDVINISDGNRIGFVADIIFIMPVGQIESIIVSPCGRRLFWPFRRREDIVVPWSNVVTVGLDAILVNLI